MKKVQLFVICLLTTITTLKSNNLQITNVTATQSTVTFEIYWENSWNIENVSRDAAWVFIKYQDCSSTDRKWEHLNLSSTSSDHSNAGSLLRVDAVSDGKGVFVRRSAFGGGNNPFTSVTLRLATPFPSANYVQTNVNFDVVGIEMVFVNEGSFWSSDGASTDRFGNNATGGIRLIENEDEIPANGLSTVGGTSSGTTNIRHPAVIAEFPKGFSSFYCMKYEITQGQYVHFLNLLPASQQGVRTAIAPTSDAGTYAMYSSATMSRRNSIKIKTPAAGNPMTQAVYACDFNNNGIYDEEGDGINIAMNYLNWGDLLAYLDWTALRPMTELEFEKACRGTATANDPTPIGGEYPWASTVWTQARAFHGTTPRLTDAGFPNEKSTTEGEGLAAMNNSTSGTNADNVNNQTGNGPLRIGFAPGPGTTRSGAGATYYGIVDMAGNVREQTMAIGNVSIGAAIFEGTLGDGNLDNNGDADQPSWGSANEAKWSSLRGGFWGGQIAEGRTSHRQAIGNTGGASRSIANGGRGVRQFAD